MAAPDIVHRLRRHACLPAALLFAWHAGASAVPPQAQDGAQVVTVQALRDVDEVPYRRILDGIAVFERYRALAPAATLRYRLHPRARGATFDGLRVTLAAGRTEIPIALDERQTFDLPRLAALAAQDAMLMTNKRAGTYAWRVDIRTPGLPPDTRRLGDLRLECMVDMQAARLRRIVMTPALAAMNAATDICASRTFRNPFFAERPLFDVTLVAGTRRWPASGCTTMRNTCCRNRCTNWPTGATRATASTSCRCGMRRGRTIRWFAWRIWMTNPTCRNTDNNVGARGQTVTAAFT